MTKEEQQEAMETLIVAAEGPELHFQELCGAFAFQQSLESYVDVTFVVNEGSTPAASITKEPRRKISAHQAYLSRYSPLLKSLFRAECFENRDGEPLRRSTDLTIIIEGGGEPDLAFAALRIVIDILYLGMSQVTDVSDYILDSVAEMSKLLGFRCLEELFSSSSRRKRKQEDVEEKEEVVPPPPQKIVKVEEADYVDLASDFEDMEEEDEEAIITCVECQLTIPMRELESHLEKCQLFLSKLKLQKVDVKARVKKLPIECYNCSKIFQNKKNYKIHMLVHYKTEIFEDIGKVEKKVDQCGVCEKKLSLNKEIKMKHYGLFHRYVLRYIKDKDVKNDLFPPPPQAPSSEYNLKALESCLASGSIVCIYCGQKYPKTKPLRIHLVSHFKKKLDEEIALYGIDQQICGICNKGLSNFDFTVRVHYGVTHGLLRKYLNEDYFNLAFPNMKKSEHHPEECEASFSEEELKKNKVLFTQAHLDGTMLCVYCGTTFPRRSQLKSHILGHFKKKIDAEIGRLREKPDECGICKKPMSTKNNEHVRLHYAMKHRLLKDYLDEDTANFLFPEISLENEKEYINFRIDVENQDLSSCPICAKKFENLKAVRLHLFTHVKNLIWDRWLRAKKANKSSVDDGQCHLCDKIFSKNRKHAIIRHLAVSHRLVREFIHKDIVDLFYENVEDEDNEENEGQPEQESKQEQPKEQQQQPEQQQQQPEQQQQLEQPEQSPNSSLLNLEVIIEEGEGGEERVTIKEVKEDGVKEDSTPDFKLDFDEMY